MSLPEDGPVEHVSMINCFTRFRDEIFRHTIDSKRNIAKPTCLEELTVCHLLSFMGTKGYANGIVAMSAEERSAACEKGYANGIGGRGEVGGL
jgi:hypothetical protein